MTGFVKGKVNIANLNDVELTMTLTMSYEAWSKLSAFVSDGGSSAWPMWKVNAVIAALLRKASTQFEETEELDL